MFVKDLDLRYVNLYENQHSNTISETNLILVISPLQQTATYSKMAHLQFGKTYCTAYIQYRSANVYGTTVQELDNESKRLANSVFHG